MKFQEQGLIIYPYISENQLIYEVDYNSGIREVIQILPDLPSDERWECFGVDVINDYESEVIVDTINVY
jgi:hypothetical protein